uniref:3'-5' exonuclease domain-containing protein n=1 Tax=Oryza punctata TaxID=4537 RepID=A0A0E0LGA9_ORYPU
MDAAATTRVSTRLRRSTPTHAAYTVYVADRRVIALVTAHPAYARRWVHTTRWLHHRLLHSGRLLVGLGVQWTPVRRPLHHASPPPPPATLQLCVGHRCLVFHLAQADAVPAVLRRFLADPRVTFVGSGSSNDRRMLTAYYDLHVASGRELRAMAGMGNASMEDMADRFLGYPGIAKPMNVAMSAWHVPYLSIEQVEYACVDAYLAFRLAIHLCPAAHQPVLRAPPPPPPPPPAPRAPVYHHPLPLGPRVAMLAAPAPRPTRPAPVRARAAPVYRAVARAEPAAAQTHWALAPTAVDDDASESGYSSKITDNARPRVAASDSDIEEEEDDDGLSIINSSSYASDGHVFSSDEFELVGHGLLSSDDEDGYEDFVLGMGALNIDIDDDECYNGNTGSIGILTVQSYNEHTSIGILTVESYDMAGTEEMFVRNEVATLEELEEDDIVTGAGTVTVDEGGGGEYGEDDWYDEDQEDYGDEPLDYVITDSQTQLFPVCETKRRLLPLGVLAAARAMAGKRPRDTPSGDTAAKRARTAARRLTTVSARLRRSETKHDTYVVRVSDSHVVTTETARPAVARRWVCATRWRHGHRLRSGAGLTVGMGLCVGNRCLVFQIAQGNAVPAALRRFLADDGVAFVGYGIRSDCRKLAAHHDLHVACTRELRAVTGMGNASMERMAEELLGLAGIKKPATVGRSRWDAPKLSKKQVKYACVDAFLSLRLGVHVGAAPASTSTSSSDSAGNSTTQESKE